MLLDSPLRTLQKERHPVVKILTGKKPNMFSVETDLRSRKIHHIMKVFRGEHKRGEVSKLPKEETLRFKNPLQEKLTILRQSKKSLKRLLECLTTKLWCLRTNSIRMRIQQLPQKLPFKNPQMMKRLQRMCQQSPKKQQLLKKLPKLLLKNHPLKNKKRMLRRWLRSSLSPNQNK